MYFIILYLIYFITFYIFVIVTEKEGENVGIQLYDTGNESNNILLVLNVIFIPALVLSLSLNVILIFPVLLTVEVTVVLSYKYVIVFITLLLTFPKYTTFDDVSHAILIVEVVPVKVIFGEYNVRNFKQLFIKLKLISTFVFNGIDTLFASL